MESLIKCGCLEFLNNHSTWSNRREDAITLVFQNKTLPL